MQKFIVVENYDGSLFLEIGNVGQHADIARKYGCYRVHGGGWWGMSYGQEGETMVFSGSSLDFGSASVNDVQRCIDERAIQSFDPESSIALSRAIAFANEMAR